MNNIAAYSTILISPLNAVILLVAVDTIVMTKSVKFVCVTNKVTELESALAVRTVMTATFSSTSSTEANISPPPKPKPHKG